MTQRQPREKPTTLKAESRLVENPAKILLLLLILGQFIYFYSSWVQIFWLGKPVNMYLTNLASDPPWMPDGQVSLPIIGTHHFGDWALLRGWILSGDPYHQQLAAYPPIALLLAEPFTWISNQSGFVLYILTTVALLASAIYRILQGIDWLLRVQLTIFLSLLNAPMLVVFDRGNNVGIMVGLISWGLINLNEKKFSRAILFLGIGAGMKLYPIVIFFALFLWGYRRVALAGFGLAVVPNVLLFSRYPGGIFENFVIFTNEVLLGRYTTGAGITPEFVINQHGPFSTVLALKCQNSGLNSTLEYFQNIPTIIKYFPLLLFLFSLGIAFRMIPNLLISREVLLLSSLQFLPLMPPYVSVWATVAGAFLVSKTSNKLQGHNKSISEKYNYIQLGLIFLILTPLPLTFGDPACNTTFNIFFGSFNFLAFFILLAAGGLQHRKNLSKTLKNTLV
jgi:ABC-type multidrug transport system fused ATPase/permease subunit